MAREEIDLFTMSDWRRQSVDLQTVLSETSQGMGEQTTHEGSRSVSFTRMSEGANGRLPSQW